MSSHASGIRSGLHRSFNNSQSLTIFPPISTFSQAWSNLLGQLLYISSEEAIEVYNNIPTVNEWLTIPNPSHDMITIISLRDYRCGVCYYFVMGSYLTVSTGVHSLKYEWSHYMASYELTLCYRGCEVMHKVCVH